ncbi:hypothetical protein FHX42_005302, partial [Saccharopolyspora lacisalsi]
MALDPILWALKDAPVATAEEKLALVVMAETANEDGTDAYPSKDTIAARACLSKETVKRLVREFQQRRLIAPGDQEAARRIPKQYRPTVYDLMIPYRWFPNVDRVNADRAARGVGPLTPGGRPDLGPAPERKARADKGVSNPSKGPGKKKAKTAGQDGETGQGEHDDPQGGLTDPPVDNSARGVYEYRVGGSMSIDQGGLTDPQTSPLNLPRETSSSERAHARDDAGTEREEENAPAREEKPSRDTGRDAEHDTDTTTPATAPEIHTGATNPPDGPNYPDDRGAGATQDVSALLERFFRSLPTHVCPNSAARSGKTGHTVAALLTDGWDTVADGPEQLAAWFTSRIPRGGVSSPAGWITSQCAYAPTAPTAGGSTGADAVPHADCPNQCDHMHFVDTYNPDTGKEQRRRCDVPHRPDDRTRREPAAAASAPPAATPAVDSSTATASDTTGV